MSFLDQEALGRPVPGLPGLQCGAALAMNQPGESSVERGESLDDPRLLPRATEASLARVRQHAPPELLALRAWVAGDRSAKTLAGGQVKSSKVPLCPRGGAGKSNDPATWGTFEEAAAFALRNPRCFGVGINLMGSEFIGLDLDHVFNRTTGDLAPEAVDLLETLPVTYCERSPSGDGLRLFLRGRKPEGMKAMFKDIFGAGTCLEVYDGSSGARYLTVTGEVHIAAPIAVATEEDLDDLLGFVQRPSPESLPVFKRTSASSDHASDFERARFVLDNVFPDPDASTYDEWLNRVMALASLGADGQELARTWCARGAKFNPKRDCTDEHFSGFKGRVKIATLFQHADRAQPGWRTAFDALHGKTRHPRRGVAQPAKSDADAASDEGLVPLGEKDPASGKVVLSPRRTLPTAKACVRDFYAHADGRTLHCFAGMLMVWRGNRYVEIEDGAVRQQLHEWLHDALRYVWNKEMRQFELGDFEANPTTVNAALATLQTHTFLAATTPQPTWLGTAEPPALPAELLPCRSMTLHLPSGRVLPPTPRLFNINALEFDYDPHAGHALRWDQFLVDLFGDDQEQRDLLQEFFGYALTADTSMQKALLIVGPRRSGKGTLARVLTHLVGAGNVCGPTISGLAGPFGLQPLLGKTMSIVSDARFAGEGVSTVVERLLCITGEDMLTIDRKHLTSVTMKLPTRFMFLTNELPRANDASTALAGRFVVLKLTRSFYGKEDIGLTDALLAELPGILLWAIEGWKRLRTNRRFTEPEATRTAVADIEDLSSPVSAFVRERCNVGPGHRASANELYTAWQGWCAADGRSQPSTRQVFLRDLSAAVAGITRRRGACNVPFYDGIGVRQGDAP